ncbi:MAG: ABC transporter ATP-binding protein [Acidobacteriota bacterium]
MWEAYSLVKRALLGPVASCSSPGVFETPRHLGYRDLGRLRPFLASHWRNGAVAVAAMLVSTLLSLPQPMLAKYVVDVVIAGHDMRLLNVVGLGMIALAVATALTGLVQNVHLLRFQQDLICEIQQRLLDRVLRLPKALLDSKQTGYLVSRVVSDVARLQALFSTGVIMVLPSAVKLTFWLGVMFWLNWRLSLQALAILPLMMLIAHRAGGRVRTLSRVAMERAAVLSRELQQSLAGLMVIKTFATESRETLRLKGILRDSIEVGVDHGVASTVATLTIGLVGTVALSLVTWAGAGQIIAGSMTLGDFVAFNACLVAIYGPAQALVSLNVAVQASFAALERVFQLLDLVPEDEDDDSKTTVRTIRGDIAFEHVMFSYDGVKPVLTDISFAARPGEMIALVGPSGAGKTTLVSLLVRLYSPSSGRIRIDGTDVAELNVRSVRERIAVVSQDVFLFDATIRDNIRYARPSASDADVREAAALAGAQQFIEELPDGYETRVGERGQRLSAGQRQRLSLARAFLKSPDVLVLDEPTSALDPLAEGEVKTAMTRFAEDRTTFVIGHRLSTVACATRILVLDKGVIVQAGSHSELIRQEGLYKSMCRNRMIADLVPAAAVSRKTGC